MATTPVEPTTAFTVPTRRISGSFSPATWHSSLTMARRCCCLPAMSWLRTELATVGAWLGTCRPPWLLSSSEPSAVRIGLHEEGEIMTQKKFLVTGATGDTGGYTVEQLLRRGHAVRALAHREDDRSKRLEKMGAEVVIGDFLKFNDVRAATRGVRGAYFCYPIRPGILQATAYFAQAAKEAGLECLLNMSQKSARGEPRAHAAQDHCHSDQVF